MVTIAYMLSAYPLFLGLEGSGSRHDKINPYTKGSEVWK